MAQLSFARRVARLPAWLSIAMLLVCGGAPSGSAQALNEYQVKAVFLFNFAQFVDISGAERAAGQPFVIGILGDDPFEDFLDQTVRGERIGDRPFVVRRFRSAAEAASADILFVSRSESRRLDPIIDALRARPVLTVSDADNFARSGGIVQFVTENNRIKFSINLGAARAANITISSKLLRNATIVASDRG